VNQAPRLRARALRLWRAPHSYLLAFATLFSLVGCNDHPSDLRVWRASDHDHTENPSSDQVQVDPAASAQAVPGLEDVTIVAWSQNCTQCHGQLGRGDGPRGPMLKATNLSDPAWQSSVTDEQIAATIKLGRGAMPSFKLPDVTIANLVKLVRMMNLARLQQHPAPAGSAAPTPSAASSGVRPGPSAASPHPAAPRSPAPAPSVKPATP
jgi:mono/diheme cytochrome c family protein